MLASPRVETALSPILDALYHGRTDEAQRLLDEVGPDGLSIHEAAAMGIVPRLEHLLAQQPDAVNAWSADGFQPLPLAAFFGRREAAELLLARGGEVNTPARNALKVSALHAALAGPAPEIAHSLVAAGADVNAVQQDGVTPLMEAASTGQLELVRLLLAHDADPKAKDGKGRTAADFARERGRTAVIEILPPG
jgi:ankyrin repeat protein